MSRLLTWKVVSFALAGSIIGLATSCLFGRGKSSFANGGPGVIIVDLFAAAWSVSLVLLLPFRIIQDRKERERDVGSMTPSGWERFSQLLNWKLVIWIVAITFAGLAISSLISFGKWSALLCGIFAGAWFVSLVVLIPLRVFLDRHDRKHIVRHVETGEIDPNEMNALSEAAFYANYGGLPRWLYLPFVILAALLVLLTVFCVTLVVAGSILQGWRA